MKMTTVLKAILVGAALFASVTHAALLDGKTIKYEYLFPTENSSQSWYGANTYVVGSGVEALGPENFFSVDFSDRNIKITYLNNINWCGCGDQTFNGVKFSDSTNSIASFTNVSLNAATTLSGLTANRLRFDADHIWVDWQSLRPQRGDVVSIDLAATNVPEPASLALLGLGLTGLAVARRKHARNG